MSETTKQLLNWLPRGFNDHAEEIRYLRMRLALAVALLEEWETLLASEPVGLTEETRMALPRLKEGL